MQHAAITGYQKGPEVETSVSFEGEEDLNIEFGDVIPCDSSEGSYGHINALVDRNRSSGFSFWDGFRRCHFGESEGGEFEQGIVEGEEWEFSNVDS